MHHIETWLNQYGYLTLFFGLLLEYIALPFPGEVVMGYSGFLADQGQMNLTVAIALAFLGTSTGMTITYALGRKLGYPFLVRFGPKLFLSEKKLKKASDIFEKYGTKLLFFSFFIPGVRHFTGYLSGTMNTPFRVFALYAYPGALFWVVSFIAGGRLLGNYWDSIRDWMIRYGAITVICVAAVAGLCWLFRVAARLSLSKVASVKDSGLRLNRLRLFLAGGFVLALSVYMISAS